MILLIVMLMSIWLPIEEERDDDDDDDGEWILRRKNDLGMGCCLRNEIKGVMCLAFMDSVRTL